MKSRSIIASVLALILFGVTPVLANGCSAAARNEANKVPGSTLLAVQSTTNSAGKVVCVVRIKLPSKNGNPGRIVTRNVSPG